MLTGSWPGSETGTRSGRGRERVAVAVLYVQGPGPQRCGQPREGIRNERRRGLLSALPKRPSVSSGFPVRIAHKVLLSRKGKFLASAAPLHTARVT